LKERIAIALSGGGFRASIYHLGVLKYLAEHNKLENISNISTVSGGSLVMGLIFKLSNNKFPTSQQFLTEVLPKMEKYFTNYKLLKSIFFSLYPFDIHSLTNRANIFGEVLYKGWEIDYNLQDLPDFPVWEINATTNETGKNWRFSKEKMGDWMLGYVEKPNFLVSNAIAASCAFPGIIGRFWLKPQNFEWKKHIYKKNEFVGKESIEIEFDTIHLSDGGVYDNLGSEPFIKFLGQELSNNIDFLIVSDASKPFKNKKSAPSWRVFTRTIRLIDITSDQIASLRMRAIHTYLNKNKNSGLFLKMGHSDPGYDFLSDENKKKVKNISTTLLPFKKEDYDLLINHGYYVTKKFHKVHGWYKSKYVFENAKKLRDILS